MPPSAKDFERAISRLREYNPDAWVGNCSPAEFLDRLQETLEWLTSYERLRHLVHAMLKLASLLRLEED